jgi:ribonuclease P protein component
VQRRLRLTHSEDIKRVRHEGRSLANTLLVLGFLPNHLQQNRIAIIAGRSVGGAFQRNYAKRRLRSAFQSLMMEFDQGFDLVLIARKPLLNVDYPLIVEGLRTLAKQAGLTKDEAN